MRRRLTTLLLVAFVVAALAAGSAVGAPAAPGATGLSSSPDDPAFAQGLQWYLPSLKVPDVWPRTTGAGITIAIVDSGIDLAQEDLAGKVVGGTACLGTGGDVRLCNGTGQDDNGHGTHVAGIAAADTDNGIGVAGVAPDAKLLAVQVLADHCDTSGCTAEGDSGDVAAGIRWATDHGAQVINLSLGSDTHSLLGPDVSAALRYAWAHGAIPVVAAGNDESQPAGFSDQPAIVVTALNREGDLASYANGVGSAKWGLAAYGGEPGDTAATCRTGGSPLGILSTYWNPRLGPNQYACLAGTSMAAPQVAGAAALLRALGFSPSQTVDRLLASADPLGTIIPNSTFGSGRLDVGRAVDMGPPPAPAPSTSEGQISPQTTPTTLAVAPPHTPTSLAPAPSPPGNVAGPGPGNAAAAPAQIVVTNPAGSVRSRMAWVAAVAAGADLTLLVGVVILRRERRQHPSR